MNGPKAQGRIRRLGSLRQGWHGIWAIRVGDKIAENHRGLMSFNRAMVCELLGRSNKGFLERVVDATNPSFIDTHEARIPSTEA
ncbi:MAG: hypothetical protein AAGK37_01130 [Pseudomonadota bacterium]